jgi:hypothetical protein
MRMKMSTVNVGTEALKKAGMFYEFPGYWSKRLEDGSEFVIYMADPETSDLSPDVPANAPCTLQRRRDYEEVYSKEYAKVAKALEYLEVYPTNTLQAIATVVHSPARPDVGLAESWDVLIAFPYAGVDRTQTRSISVPYNKAKMAARVAAAINSQKAVGNPKVATDVEGKTYVSFESKIMGRYMEKCLRELGF